MSDVEPVRVHLRVDGSVEINGIYYPNVLSIQEPLAVLAQLSDQPDLYIYSDNEADYYGIGKIIYTVNRVGFGEGKIKQMFGKIQSPAPLQDDSRPRQT